MTTLEQAKTRLEEYKKKQEELISVFKEEYDIDILDEENVDLLEAIYDGSIVLSLQERSQFEYLT